MESVPQFLSEKARGVYIICATPFKKDGSIDYKSVDTLIEFYLEKGVAGITILGMMGEADKMSSQEALDFMSYSVKRVNGRVPIIVGISNSGIPSYQYKYSFSFNNKVESHFLPLMESILCSPVPSFLYFNDL